MIRTYTRPERDTLRQAITAAYHEDESTCVRTLLKVAWLPEGSRSRIRDTAAALVTAVRQQPASEGVEALMSEYRLSSHEGIVLMCLAEALLRIPDNSTVDKLIEDKLTNAEWQRHLGHSDSLFVNASTWAFMLTGRLLDARVEGMHDLRHTLLGLLARSSEPLIRNAMLHAMRILGRQFIMGRTIKEALKRSHQSGYRRFRYSFDMLGEAARTQHDADSYFERYHEAIAAIAADNDESRHDSPGISIKLSALDPRYEVSQYTQCMHRLLPRIQELARHARRAGIGFTIDAEEASRLELSLDIVNALLCDDSLSGWEGLGLAIQAYQKRAIHVIRWLSAVCREKRRRVQVRLVKGAYWDTEIKLAQENGVRDYPVFTRKASTDVAYLACARMLLENSDVLYPQFATHNAHTVASVIELAQNSSTAVRGFEFQRLYGMGESLYKETIDRYDLPCRVYAPCGGHRDLLAYLARRLLENGANTSFVHRIADQSVPVEHIIADPLETVSGLASIRATHIHLPEDLYGGERRNSAGLDLTDEHTLAVLGNSMRPFASATWQAAPVVNGIVQNRGHNVTVVEPANHSRIVGQVIEAEQHAIETALQTAEAFSMDWQKTPVETRADCLEQAAGLIEANHPELMTLLVREAGRTLSDAVAEIREAADFCRYYAARARLDCDNKPNAEIEAGVFACISPWNFPLAIFTGQIAAALVTGNSVIAKPAEQTPLIAHRVTQLLLEAGVPSDALQFLPGEGETVGAAIVSDRRISGVAFTGGLDAAHAIRHATAGRGITLIAETGGINAMIMDSSALLEQAVPDILRSAFGSAGQRCSSLRVLCVQDDIADATIDMLTGAMAELRIGDPGLLQTDVGPLIDETARARLQRHCERLDKQARLIYRCTLPDDLPQGSFFSPRAYEIESLDLIEEETFGPVLHVIRYESADLDSVIKAINSLGYGLTFGLHSRIDTTARRVTGQLHIGNMYINRHMTGSVVGSQPFGGEGLSGTGPKAGGPHYLPRFMRRHTQRLTTVTRSKAVHDQEMAEKLTTAPADIGSADRHATQHVSATDTSINSESELLADVLQTVRRRTDWEERSRVSERIAVMCRFAEILKTKTDALLDYYQIGSGSTTAQAKSEFEQSVALTSDYIMQAKQLLTDPIILPGPVGEHNELNLHARGLFLCLADAPFALAGFIKLLIPALITGNRAIALSSKKSAPIQQSIIQLLQEAGLPDGVVRHLPGNPVSVRTTLLNHPDIAGVCITSWQEEINLVDLALAARKGALLPLIATPLDAGIEALEGNDDLLRYATERVISINTAAAGGNPELYNLDD